MLSTLSTPLRKLIKIRKKKKGEAKTLFFKKRRRKKWKEGREKKEW